jgi:hypothetical protein
MKANKTTAIILLAISLVCVFIAGNSFLSMHKKEPIVNGPGVSEVKMLSDYYPDIKGTSGDTEIYILRGDNPGGSILVFGGTHPNEPSGLLATVLLIENAKLEKGTLFVIPRANNSGFTHNDPQEGSPQRFSIETDFGERWFRYGSRATNPIDQWPDPDVYIHASSRQQLSGSETRNLNRGYPGRDDGTFTEKVCYGFAEFIRKEDITLTIDLHEASPEYPVINAIVSHENAMDIASLVVMNLEFEGVNIGLEPSPVNLHGLTHRELGDYTDTLSVLMETANASQGRLRGKTNEALVLEGKDPMYVKAKQLDRLYVPFDESGHPLKERVGRHVAGIIEFSESLSYVYPDKEVIIENIPSYEEILANGIGKYLRKPI